MKDLIAQYCKELRLGNRIVEQYEKIEANSNEEFLVKLLQLEIENRSVSRKNRLLKQANFDVLKTFHGYGFERVELPKSVSIEDLQNGTFIERKENLILYGSVGTGKTHLATALGVEACSQGKHDFFSDSCISK